MHPTKHIINIFVVIVVILFQLAMPLKSLADDSVPPQDTSTDILTAAPQSTESPAVASPAAAASVEPSSTADPSPSEVVPTDTAVPPAADSPTAAESPTAAVATDPASTGDASPTDVIPTDTAVPPAADSPTAAESPTAAASVEPSSTADASPSDVVPTDTAAPTAAESPTAAATAEPASAVESPTAAATTGPTSDGTPTDETATVQPNAQAKLAQEQAASMIASSDPIWCPAGHVPSDHDGTCTDPQASITDLVSYLQTHPTFSGDGTIYFTVGSYGGAETSITLDHTQLTGLGTLGLYGGWDLGGTDTQTGTTTFTVPVLIAWNSGAAAQDNVTLQDLIINLLPNNPNSALYVDTDGDVTVDTVTTSGGAAGAEIVNYSGAGNANVTNSNFGQSANSGLFVLSSGNVTVSQVNASSNHTGIYIDNTSGTGTITLSNIITNNNGWTGTDARSAGDISVNTIEADNNLIGTYLQSTIGAGNIFVTAGTFTDNQDFGLKAITNTGNVQVDTVTAGNSTPKPVSIGAWLKSYGGGSVSVTDSIFNNAETGLFVVGTGAVTLTNVTAENNSGNGALIESGQVFGCFGPQGIPVTVDGGTYQDNGGYGFVVYPGSAGSLTLAGVIAFLDNTNGNSHLDLTKGCPPPCPSGKSSPGKTYNVVTVPDDGGTPVAADCTTFSGTALVLPNGSKVTLKCPSKGDFLIQHLANGGLPGPLPLGPVFVEGINATLDQNGVSTTVLSDGGSLQLSFAIPEGMDTKKFSILFWDPTANAGAGGWVELPFAQFVGEPLPLHPDAPDDGMQILSGIQQSDGTVTATVNFTGIFVLVAR